MTKKKRQAKKCCSYLPESPASMMSGQASPVAHLGHSQSDAILIILIILILIILIIVIIAITVTLTIFATIKGNQDLKRTKRLWKMCLKLLCLSMAVDGSIARLPNIYKDFRFHNVHHSQS